MFLSDIAIVLSIPKGPTRWHRNLKSLLTLIKAAGGIYDFHNALSNKKL